MKIILILSTLFGTIIIGCILYFFSGIFKKIGVTDVEEMNASEMAVTEDGVLEENFPDELMTTKEATAVNVAGRLLFLIAGSLIWIFIGLTVGQIAFLMRPSDLMAILFYFFIYIFCLRFPFGVVNKTIKKTYEVDLMPEKLVFVILLILSYIIGINNYKNMPEFLSWQLSLIK